MNNIFLDKIDAAPLANSDFSFDFNSWIANTIDTLNEVISDIQGAFNIFYPPSYTATQIAAFQANSQLDDGVLLYDTTNNEYVGRISGSLVKFTTAAYP